MAKFTGKLVSNVGVDVRWCETEIRQGIGNGRLPEELEDTFTFELVEVDGEKVAVLDWA